MRPSLRSRVRKQDFTSLEEFVEVMIKIENDVATEHNEILRMINRNTSNSSQDVNAGISASDNPQPRYNPYNGRTQTGTIPRNPYRYCSEMHFPSQCPVNPYIQTDGNIRNFAPVHAENQNANINRTPKNAVTSREAEGMTERE